MAQLLKSLVAIGLIAVGALLVYGLFSGFDDVFVQAVAYLLGVVGIGSAVVVGVFSLRGPPSDYEPPID